MRELATDSGAEAKRSTLPAVTCIHGKYQAPRGYTFILIEAPSFQTVGELRDPSMADLIV